MDFIKAIRPLNLFIVGLTQWITYFLLINPYFLKLDHIAFKLTDNHLIYTIIIITILITASGYLINDLFDFDIDRINNKSKKLSKKNISFFYLIISICGFVFSLFVASLYGNIWLSSLYLMAITGLIIYSYFLQKTPLWGNLFVSLFSALVIGIIWYSEAQAINSISYPKTEIVKQVLIGFMLFSFIVSLQRELIKDMEDIEGDSIANFRTFPILIGIKKARILAVLLNLILLTSLAIWIFWYSETSQILGYLSFFILLITAGYTCYHTGKMESKEDFKKTSKLLKTLMLLGLIYLSLISIDLWTF